LSTFILTPNRDVAAKIINVVFTIDDGPHRYIERINIHGNTFTRDEVIRREFDIAEGDAYNRGLIDRAERRLKQLAPFKSGEDRGRQGLDAGSGGAQRRRRKSSKPAILSFSGGYSTSVGIIGEVSVFGTQLSRPWAIRESICCASANTCAAALCHSSSPISWATACRFGLDLFFKETLTIRRSPTASESYGAGIKVSAPLMEGATSEAALLAGQPECVARSDADGLHPPERLDHMPSVAVKQAALNWRPMGVDDRIDAWRMTKNRNPGSGPEGAEPGLHARSGGGGCSRALHNRRR